MDRSYYENYHELEKNHWWHKARIEILKDILNSKLDKRNKIKILNVGSCTGETSLILNKFGTVDSLEYDYETYKYLKTNNKINPIHGDVTRMSFKDNKYDLICCFDVLEHISNDNLALKEMNRCLKPKGILFLTVPSYKFLWSDHDVKMHHFRRYNIKEINEKIKINNYKVIKSSYFNTFLFFPILLVRFLKKIVNSESSPDYLIPNKIFNFLFYEIFLLEKKILKFSKFPFGVSLFSISEKIK